MRQSSRQGKPLQTGSCDANSCQRIPCHIWRSIVATVSRQLTSIYGKGFSDKSLRRMIQFGEVFPDEKIVASLLRQLSWTLFTFLIPIKDPLKRDFYAEMCRIEKWNVRTLDKKINSMLFERTALSKKPESLIDAEI